MVPTFDTLFGGLAAVLVLYFLLGFLPRLPLLFRALIAGGVPLFTYFVLLIGRAWPGLDVIAIHVSVFVAAAALLFVLSRYRARHGRLHWAPRMFVVFFVGLVLLNATFLEIATNGLPEPVAKWWLGDKGKPDGEVHSGFSGVVEHGEMAAKGVSSGLSQRHKQKLLGWKLESEGLDPDGGTQRAVIVRVRDRTGLPVAGLALEIDLARPGDTAALTQTVLAEGEDGVYGGTLVLPQKGRWIGTLRLTRGGEEKFVQTRELIAP